MFARASPRTGTLLRRLTLRAIVFMSQAAQYESYRPTFLIFASPTDVHSLVHRSWELTSLAASLSNIEGFPLTYLAAVEYGCIVLWYPLGALLHSTRLSHSLPQLSVDSSGCFLHIFQDELHYYLRMRSCL
jgi:hypothetical protein